MVAIDFPPDSTQVTQATDVAPGRPTLTRVTTTADSSERSAANERAAWTGDELLADLHKIASRRVWFGHHSVGRDVLDGALSLAREAGVELLIGEGPIGRNGAPLEKMAEWERTVTSLPRARQGRGTDTAIVAMKLCSVDFTPSTDVVALADAYEGAVDRVRSARRDVRVLHVTPPLTARQTDGKSRLQRFLGRSVWEDEANLKRLEYADRIVARFPGEPLFDLGLLQSRRHDGTREMYLVNPPDNAVDRRARLVPFLWPGWTHDGVHLHDAGKRMAGRAFVRALAQAV